MNGMTIQCEDVDRFIKVCAGLVRESVCFEADAATLTIVCTGGY